MTDEKKIKWDRLSSQVKIDWYKFDIDEDERKLTGHGLHGCQGIVEFKHPNGEIEILTVRVEGTPRMDATDGQWYKWAWYTGKGFAFASSLDGGDSNRLEHYTEAQMNARDYLKGFLCQIESDMFESACIPEHQTMTGRILWCKYMDMTDEQVDEMFKNKIDALEKQVGELSSKLDISDTNRKYWAQSFQKCQDDSEKLREELKKKKHKDVEKYIKKFNETVNERVGERKADWKERYFKEGYRAGFQDASKPEDMFLRVSEALRDATPEIIEKTKLSIAEDQQKELGTLYTSPANAEQENEEVNDD